MPAGYTRAALDALKAAEFAIAEDGARNTLALALLACLADPDPSLRDGIAFEALQRFMRNKQLTADTLRTIESTLRARLTTPDPAGFSRPFAALVLSESARADRVEPFLSNEERAALLTSAIAYFTSVRDYRGFDDHEGWRHGVAHSADLLMQLSRNTAYGRDDLTRVRDAIATQIAPEEHFYIYGESERLAVPILMIAARGVFTEAEWTAWFAQIAAPAPFASWRDVFSSQRGLAKRHNTTAFVSTIYVNARVSANPAYAALLPGAEAALRALP